MFGSQAMARDVGVEAGRNISILQSDSAVVKSGKLQDIIDTTLAITDKLSSDKDSLFSLMYRTGIHESGQLEHLSQSGGGPAKSYFQVEPTTAADVVQRWANLKTNTGAMAALEKTSGLTRSKLLSMSKHELGDLLVSNQLFAASVARYRYKMDPSNIPASLEAQAEYWQRVYQRGGKKVARRRIKSFVNSNLNFSKKVSAVMLEQQKTLSKGGTATSKAVRFIKKILPR
jgi:hypothetical protein